MPHTNKVEQNGFAMENEFGSHVPLAVGKFYFQAVNLAKANSEKARFSYFHAITSIL